MSTHKRDKAEQEVWDQADKVYAEVDKLYQKADRLADSCWEQSDCGDAPRKLAGWRLRWELWRRRWRPMLYYWVKPIAIWRRVPVPYKVHCFWSKADAMAAIASGRLPAGTYWDLKK